MAQLSPAHGMMGPLHPAALPIAPLTVSAKSGLLAAELAVTCLLLLSWAVPHRAHMILPLSGSARLARLPALRAGRVRLAKASSGSLRLALLTLTPWSGMLASGGPAPSLAPLENPMSTLKDMGVPATAA